MRNLLISGMVALCAGCGWFDNPTPDEARLSIQGEAGKTVRLIVSTQFVASTNGAQTRIVIFEADTVMITLPYEKVYPIEDDQRFFAETSRVDADLQTVRMQVFVDSRKQFDDQGSLVEGGPPFRFIYMFNQPITREIVVI